MQKNIYRVADNQNGNNSSSIVKPEPLSIPEDCTPSDEAFAAVVDDLINDIILDFCFQLHPASKIGLFQADGGDKDVQETEDIFGHVRGKLKHERINCPNCDKKMDPTRFANHVENCSMGNGRQSGRNANKKTTPVDYKCGDSDFDDDDDDENQSDVSYGSSGRKRNARKKNAKNIPRKKINRDGFFELTGGLQTPPDMKQFLASYCGVKSKHTKKMCMNTINCSQHTLLQKNEMRTQHNAHVFIDQNQLKIEDVPIDVDTVDEEINGMNSESSTPDLVNDDSE